MPRSLPARVTLAVALLLGLGLRLSVVFGDEGISWPDEIYQSFEPAHRLVFGYGLVPWEFIDGARTWALPALVALILKLCALFGGDSPFVYVRATKLVFALLSLGTALGAYRLALVLIDEPQNPKKELPAALAAAVFALAAPVLYFSHRAMSENATALPVVWGLALVLDERSPRRLLLLGASLLGLAVLFRLQSGVFCAGALGILLARRGKPAAEAAASAKRATGAATGDGAESSSAAAKSRAAVRDVALVLLGWALVYGAWDAAAWHDAPGAKYGGWFHSALVYLRFNLLEGKAAAWGTSPWSYYLETLWSSMAGVTVLLAVGAALAARRATGLLVVVLAFLLLHSVTPHKELRFILPVLPLAAALLGVGLATLGDELVLRVVGPLVAVVLAASVFTSRSLTFGQLGAYPERPNDSAWNDAGAVNRLLLEASRHDDVCGLRVDVHLAWSGGSTYLHRNAPLYMPGAPPQARHFNYAVVRAGSGAPVVAADSGWELVKLPLPGGCVPDPGYSWRLP